MKEQFREVFYKIQYGADAHLRIDIMGSNLLVKGHGDFCPCMATLPGMGGRLQYCAHLCLDGMVCTHTTSPMAQVVRVDRYSGHHELASEHETSEVLKLAHLVEIEKREDARWVLITLQQWRKNEWRNAQ